MAKIAVDYRTFQVNGPILVQSVVYPHYKWSNQCGSVAQADIAVNDEFGCSVVCMDNVAAMIKA